MHKTSVQYHQKNLAWVLLLNLSITVAQIIGGLISGSMALVGDALHNFSDAGAILLAWVAIRLTEVNATSTRTFGFKRAEIIAALINGATLLGISVWLIIEAIDRWGAVKEIGSDWVISLAVLSIFINGLSAWLLRKGAKTSLNLRAAYIHLFTDLLTSFAVLAGGLMYKYYHFYWLDPPLTIVIAGYVAWSAVSVLKKSISIMMMFAPDHTDTGKIINDICTLKSIKGIHHVHLWQLNDRQVHFEAHVEFEANCSLEEAGRVMEQISALLAEKYHIHHTTLQPEYDPPHKRDVIVH
ncbi:MAG: cation diffusion facilitator family transporter [Bacteroidales bacterium]